MDGVIQGGWGYVWAVYGLTWVVLLGYAGALVLQSRSASLGATAPGPQTEGER